MVSIRGLHYRKSTRTEIVRYEIQRLRVVLHIRVQTRKVEAVQDVVLLDFAEILIAFRRQKP